MELQHYEFQGELIVLLIMILIILGGYLYYYYRGTRSKQYYLAISGAIAFAVFGVYLFLGKTRVNQVTIEKDTAISRSYNFFNMIKGDYPYDWNHNSYIVNNSDQPWVYFHLGDPNDPDDWFAILIKPGEKILQRGEDKPWRAFFEPRYYKEGDGDETKFFLGQASYLMVDSVFDKLKIEPAESHSGGRGRSPFYTYPYSFKK